jgi:hypothetical protein
MPQRSITPKKQKAARRQTRAMADASAAAKQPAPNKAKPPRPKKIQDVEDIERADSEGMAQPQAIPAKSEKRKR